MGEELVADGGRGLMAAAAGNVVTAGAGDKSAAGERVCGRRVSPIREVVFTHWNDVGDYERIGRGARWSRADEP